MNTRERRCVGLQVVGCGRQRAQDWFPLGHAVPVLVLYHLIKKCGRKFHVNSSLLSIE